MNERFPYEQLIGEKLQSLPVPDMQDAIWARVKAQLDIDLPTGDGEDGSAPQSPSGPTIIGWGLSVVIIALITTFFILKNKPKTKNTNSDPASTEKITSPHVQNNGPPLPKNNSNKKAAAPVDAKANSPLDVVVNDSVGRQDLGVLHPAASDSLQTEPPPQLVTISPPKTDTIAQAKKGRGVKGLNDSDYRIVPKKN